MLKWLLILTFGFIVNLGSAQEKKASLNRLDSLLMDEPLKSKKEWEKLLSAASDTRKVRILCQLGHVCYSENPVEAVEYLYQAYALATRIQDNDGKALALLYIVYKSNKSRSRDQTIQLLVRADASLNSESKWTLKYRIWSYLAELYKHKKQYPLFLQYHRNIITELHDRDAYPFRIHSMVKICNQARLENDYKTELYYTRLMFRTGLNGDEMNRYTERPPFFQTIIERLGAFYNHHGMYREASGIYQRVLDTLAFMKIDPLLELYFKGKLHGWMGRNFHHWGRLDEALLHHDSAFWYFYKVYEQYPEISQNKKFPFKGEWSINVANQMEEKAGVLIRKGEFSQAKTYLENSIQIRRKNKDVLGIAMSMNHLGEILAQKGMFGQALVLYDSAIQIKTQFLEDFHGRTDSTEASYWNQIVVESQCDSYLKIAALFHQWGYTARTTEYVSKALVLARSVSYRKGQAESWIALGNVQMANSRNKEALQSYQEAERIYNAMWNRPGMAKVHECTGNYYSKRGDTRKALEHFLTAKSIYTEIDMPASIAELCYQTANLLIQTHQYHEAISDYSRAIHLADSLSLKTLQANCHLQLSTALALMHDTARAFIHQKAYSRLKDELFNDEISQRLAVLEIQNRISFQQERLKDLKTENEMNRIKNQRMRTLLLSLSAMIIVFIFITLLYIRLFRERAWHEHTRIQQKLLRSQMNPHFIYNSLGSIQNYILSGEPVIAAGYWPDFPNLSATY